MEHPATPTAQFNKVEVTAADTNVNRLTATPTMAHDMIIVPQGGDVLVGPGSDKCVIPVFDDSYAPLGAGGGVTDLSQWYYKASAAGVKLTVIYTLLVGMLCLLSIDAMGAASVAPAPPTTAWSRDFIRSTNANEAVSKLGIIGGGTLTVNSDHFAMSGDKLNFKSGSLITNPVFTATGLGYYLTLGPNEYGKLKFDEINVKAPPYNAKGDGTTDDTAAIQAALDTAYTGNGFSTKRGRKIYIPEGEYKITASLVLYGGTKLRGSQTESSILHGYVTNAPLLKYEDSATTQSNAHLDMEDFSLYNFAGASSGDGIYLDGTFGALDTGGTTFNLRNIVVYNFAGNGTSSKGNMDSVWSNVKSVTCGKNGHYFSTNSFNTSCDFHLSSIGCTEFGVRGVAAYSTFRGSADANQFGGWRFDQGTAINFLGGAEFNKSNALDAKSVFGMTISGGMFATLATNTFSAIKLDGCFGVTISGIDIGGGVDGSPAAGAAPIYVTNSSGVSVEGNTYWEKWNDKYIVSDGGVKEGVNYAKTTSRVPYNHTMTEALWELEADSATMRLDTKTDTRTSYTWANSGTDNWSIQDARTSHELFLYNHGASSNVWTVAYDNSAYKFHIPMVAQRGLSVGTNSPQSEALYVRGVAKVKSDTQPQVTVDTYSAIDPVLDFSVQGSSMWWFRGASSTFRFFSYTDWREDGLSGPAFEPANVFTVNNGFDRFNMHWDLAAGKKVAVGVDAVQADTFHVAGTTKLAGNTDVTGSLTISGAAVATQSYVDSAVAGVSGGTVVNTNVLATTNWVADRILEATNNLLMPILQTVYKTNVVSLTGDHGFINCETNAATYQFLAVAGNITLHTTNRSVRSGATPVTVTLRGTNVATTVTLDTNWDNRGTNTWFTLPANKRATLQVLLYGTAETEVTAAYGIQTN